MLTNALSSKLSFAKFSCWAQLLSGGTEKNVNTLKTAKNFRHLWGNGDYTGYSAQPISRVRKQPAWDLRKMRTREQISDATGPPWLKPDLKSAWNSKSVCVPGCPPQIIDHEHDLTNTYRDGVSDRQPGQIICCFVVWSSSILSCFAPLLTSSFSIFLYKT